MANIIQTFPKGSSGGTGGGHTILNTNGTSVAQESKLQFIGADVTDDSTNGITKVAGAGLNSDSLDDIVAGAATPTNVRVGDANNYSTTEKIIGQQINGKPLYQKVVTGTSGGTGAWKTIASIGTTCIIVDGSCYVAPNSGQFGTYPIPYGLNDGRIAYNYNATSDAYEPGTVGLNIGTNTGSMANKSCYVILKYYKTTD